MKIVKESLGDPQGFLRSDNPFKNLDIGMSEVVREKLLKHQIGPDELERTRQDLEELSRWTTGRKENPKMGKELSHIFGQQFDEDYAGKKDTSPYSSVECRSFVKNLIFGVRRNNNKIDLRDTVVVYEEFMKKFHPDPMWFKEMIDSLLYGVQMY